MSTTDELLEEMLEDVEEYATPVTDDDLQFWIDEHLRVISIPKNGVVAGVEGDKNVNKIKFGMNRYYHDFDMSTFSGRILYSNAKGNKNYYNITDMQASGSAITFSWLVVHGQSRVRSLPLQNSGLGAAAEILFNVGDTESIGRNGSRFRCTSRKTDGHHRADERGDQRLRRRSQEKPAGRLHGDDGAG